MGASRQSQDAGASLVARYPDQVTLVPSRKKWMTLLAVVGLFASGFVLQLATDPENAGNWAALCGCALAFGAFILMALPRGNGLRLDREGFENLSMFFRRRSFRWSEVSDFRVECDRAAAEHVVFDDLNAGKRRRMYDTYGLPAEVLASVMTRWAHRSTHDNFCGRAAIFRTHSHSAEIGAQGLQRFRMMARSRSSRDAISRSTPWAVGR